VDDVYVLSPRWVDRGGGHGSFVAGSEDVVFYQITIKAAANECFGSFYATRHGIIKTNLALGEGRVLGVNNGGHNHHNSRQGPWVEGCLFENTGDDTCHVNGYLMGIKNQISPTKLEFNRHQPYDQFGPAMDLDHREGDRLVVFSRAQGRVLGTTRVAHVERKGKSVIVTTTEPVTWANPGVIRPIKGAGYAEAGMHELTEVYNLDRMCNEFVFRNNIARKGRRVGVLAKGYRGLIENNQFLNLGGGGVEFWNAPFEGLSAIDYVVRNNDIIDCGRVRRHHAGIWVTLFKSGAGQEHKNILIENNRIRNFNGPDLLLNDIDGCLLRNNTAENPMFNNVRMIQE
jgi:hypothetical protein